jgi:hypothetical protein
MKTKMAILGFILFFCCSAGAGIVPVNSNSKIIDGIEYYFQTDKAVYTLGENVEMLYRVMNLNNYTVTLEFGAFPIYNFWADKDGINVWERNFGTTDVPVVNYLTLVAGASKFFPWDNPPYLWNMKDNYGNIINLGEYQVIGGFDVYGPNGNYEYSKVSVPITIIPEPASVFLFSIGILGIFFRKNK